MLSPVHSERAKKLESVTNCGQDISGHSAFNMIHSFYWYKLEQEVILLNSRLEDIYF